MHRPPRRLHHLGVHVPSKVTLALVWGIAGEITEMVNKRGMASLFTRNHPSGAITILMVQYDYFPLINRVDLSRPYQESLAAICNYA